MSDQESLEDRVTRLEELHSHQEHLLQQLNEIVLQLRLDYDSLRSGLETQVRRLESRLERQSNPLDAHEKPPHY